MPSSIPLTLGKNDATGIDFLVLSKSKTIDIRGYVTFKDVNNSCPEEKVKNLYVEFKRMADKDNEEIDYPTSKVMMTCQFVFPRLSRGEYNVKIFEKQGKSYTKVLSQSRIDLTNDINVNDGVYIHHVTIEKKNASFQDDLSSSFFSPIVMVLLILSIFKWNTTVSIIEKIISIFYK